MSLITSIPVRYPVVRFSAEGNKPASQDPLRTSPQSTPTEAIGDIPTEKITYTLKPYMLQPTEEKALEINSEQLYRLAWKVNEILPPQVGTLHPQKIAQLLVQYLDPKFVNFGTEPYDLQLRVSDIFQTYCSFLREEQQKNERISANTPV